MPPVYELYAIKYGHHQRKRTTDFLGGDPHDGPMPMDYFVWLARSADRTFVIDTGFSQAGADHRKRQWLRSPAEGLQLLNVDAATVRDVIVTHLHYDHIGNGDQFPAAKFYLQDREMQFATGRYMCLDCFQHSFDVENILDMVDGWRRLEALADSHQRIVPGHDPEVLRRYRAPSASMQGIVARLDVAPAA